MYRGRFAPSPTGPLHFGSLVTAVASYLDAKAAGGEWIVRIEDVDTPRTVAGADREILKTLRQFGFVFSDDVVYQSRRADLYRAALDRLRHDNAVYPCTCSRREICSCFTAGIQPGRPVAWRVRGAGDVGDFVAFRADGLFAYQLAVVVDDGDQGITDVVRGADLLDSTPRQMYLQELLSLPHPQYLHVPVVVNEDGEKLSKQTHAPALNDAEPVIELRAALRFLGQREVDSLGTAILNWNPDAIPRRLSAQRG